MYSEKIRPWLPQIGYPKLVNNLIITSSVSPFPICKMGIVILPHLTGTL